MKTYHSLHHREATLHPGVALLCIHPVTCYPKPHAYCGMLVELVELHG